MEQNKIFFEVVPDCFVLFSFIQKDDVGECMLHMYIVKVNFVLQTVYKMIC